MINFALHEALELLPQIVLVVVVAFFILHYSFYQWWRHAAGWFIMAFAIGLSLLSAAQILFHYRPGEGRFVNDITLGFMAVVVIWQTIAMLRINRRRPDDTDDCGG